MRISKIKLNTEHWTTEYIPISYKNIITASQYKIAWEKNRWCQNISYIYA